MKLLMPLILLCGFGAASASADTQGCRRKPQQEREKRVKELIDSMRFVGDWNRPHWHPLDNVIPSHWEDLDRLTRDLLKR